MQPTFGVAIVTYNGASRVAALLETIQPQMEWIDQLLIAEDPCPYANVHDSLISLALQYDANLITGTEWGCMQGNATRAMRSMQTDVVALFSDDILLTPGCLEDMVKFWRQWWHFPIGAAQFSYWPCWSDLLERSLILKPEEFWTRRADYLNKVPRNAHWDFDGLPRTYINVNGSGFTIRKDIWESVGGFSPETWCYDEDIAVRIWLCSPHVVVTVPGRPFVHYGGASQCGTEHPEAKFHTLDAWIKAWGCDKSTLDPLMRRSMAQRDYINDLFRIDPSDPRAEIVKKLDGDAR